MRGLGSAVSSRSTSEFGAGPVARAALIALIMAQFALGLQDREPNVQGPAKFKVYRDSKRDPQTVYYDDALLEIREGALDLSLELEVIPLRSGDVPALDPGMTNVTMGPRRGYRLLPHGTRFKKPVRLTLPFDASLIPAGLGPEDVRTFFFDESAKRWRALACAGIDARACKVSSTTEHFTDFINATVTVPDHPGLASFTPTEIRNLLATDPGTGISLIDPPAGNSTGSGSLGYVLEVPTGRGGLQPSLSATYTSGGADGWVGLGWDLTQDGITVDTRWGVPRYDAALETESYLAGGHALAPLAHRAEFRPREAEKTFRYRVEGRFHRVVRHGDHPSRYWWEITDKNGRRHFYGGDPEMGGPVAESTLSTAGGDIYSWALRQIRDPNGNFVRYRHVRVEDAGVGGGSVPGVELYLQSIRYTGRGGSEGPYKVTFVRDRELGEPRRPDVAIDCRGGFKRVTADLLRRVDVSLNDALIRRYEFKYREGAFRKTLLEAIVQYGEGGTTEFNRHTFEYFDEIRTPTGAYAAFTRGPDWQLHHDQVTAGLLGQGQASAISGSIGTSTGGHLYLGFNPDEPSKPGSFGFKVGFNRSSGEGALALVDVNGDNLPDKVFRSGGGFAYRPNQSGPNGTTVFGPLQPIPTLPAVSRDRSTTWSLGAEAYLVANVFVNRAETFTHGTTYFAEVNGDGFMDLVREGQVLFGRLDAAGHPTFTPNSAETGVPVGPGTVDASEILEDYEALYQQQIDTFPLQDTLRRWVAPFAGTVKVTAPVRLLQDTSPERVEYLTADGVRVAVQHNGGELWSASIGPNDYAERTPTGLETLPVQRGDRIYFRVQSVFDGAFDQVSWDPDITYLNVGSVTDVNALNVHRYKASGDFTFAGRRGIFVRMPVQGTVRLTGDLKKKEPTSDDVTLLVTKNGTEVLKKTLTWNETGTIGVNEDFPVAPRDQVQLRVKVDSNVDLGQVEWVPSLFYVDAPGVGQITDDQGNFLLQLFPPYDIDFYPVNDLGAPQEAWTATQTGTLTVVPEIQAAPNVGNVTGEVFVTVKKERELVGKKRIVFGPGEGADHSFTAGVTVGDKLYFDYSSYDPQLKDKLVQKTIKVAYGDPQTVPTVGVPSAFHSAALQDHHLFPGGYRGWAAAGYNGNRERAQAAVDEGLLVFNEHDYEGDDSHTKVRAYLFNPFPSTGRWRGPDELGWISAGEVSSTRLGLKYIEVPRTGQFAGLRAVSRLSRTRQTAVGLGVSLLSGSRSDSNSEGLVDYQDLNGDRFPDVLGNGRVQYSLPTGGLEATSRPVGGMSKVRRCEETQRNFGVGGSSAFWKSDSDGEQTGDERRSGSQMAALGLSGNLALGESHQRTELVDLNGDGLPDRVSTNGSDLSVAFNLGYGFAPSEPWGNSAVSEGANRGGSLGANLGFNGGIYDFAGGLSLSKNDSEYTILLIDVNGDGLPDRVRPGSGHLKVSINTGNGFSAAEDWTGALNKGVSDNANVSLGGGVYFTVGIGPVCLVGCYIIINPGADFSRSMSRLESSVRDVDGDGYADHVASERDDSLQVARNLTGKTNLLRKVVRPLGATVTLDYSRTGNTSGQPHSRWVLSRTEVFDGHAGDGVDTVVMSYRYEDGRFERRERQFLGYARVTTEQRDPSQGEALYRTVTREFRNDSVYTMGLLLKEVTSDGAGNVFVETENTYVLRDVGTGLEPADASEASDAIFPRLSRSDQRFFEGGPAPRKSTHLTRDHDALGNVTRLFDAGDLGAQDDVTTVVTYSDFPGPYIVGKPLTLRGSANGALLRHRESTIDPLTGNLAEVRSFVGNGEVSSTTFLYFPNGNLKSVTGAPNRAGQTYVLSYEYDSVAETHATRIEDSFGYVSRAEYDLKHGKKTATVDVNQNRISFTYDLFGRVTSVTAPNEQAGPGPTVLFEYHPEAAVPWSVTRHLDRFRDPDDRIETVHFADGLRRSLQTKKDVTVHAGPDGGAQDVMVVSGANVLDFLGRVVEQRYPTTEPLGTSGVFNAWSDGVAPTRFSFDVLDRQTRLTLPDGTVTLIEYGFGVDRDGVLQFVTTLTDANQNRSLSYRNLRDFPTSVQEFVTSKGQTVWTSYVQDALGQIVEIKDDQGNRTTFGYDLIGRQTSVDSPDKGRTEQRYDLAGNVVERVTANLRAENKVVRYDHEFNRLKAVSYPRFPANNVTYEYGPPGAPRNRASRLFRVADASGTVERAFGPLGEIVEETRFMPGLEVSGNDDAKRTFTTRFVFDSFNRLQQLTYPDQEVLTYRHDSAGMLREVRGLKEGTEQVYLARLEYDKFGQRAFMKLGNAIGTSFAYDPLSRRLSAVTSSQAGQVPFQNLRYGYDAVGNILRLENQVDMPRHALGGPALQTFTYDSLYRLTSARGSFTGDLHGLGTSEYALDMDYDTIHNIRRKSQTHRVNGKLEKATSYDWTYHYQGSHPHAPTKIGSREFTYDADGNQTAFDGPDDGGPPGGGSGQTRRTLTWDEEDRVVSITDQRGGGKSATGATTSFVYDHSGHRALKRSDGHTTAYASAHFTLRNRDRQMLFTKHVFAAGVRIASNAISVPQDVNNTPNQVGFLFYYHGDHLSSTQFVSDRDGRLREHVEYFPFGEPWVTQKLDNADGVTDVSYLFTGKEMDRETNLYYFGDRYYDARTSVWQSADPTIASFSGGSTVEDFSNMMGHSAYTRGRPTRFVDPNGRNEEDFHLYTTYYLGLRTGMDRDKARVIALATQYTDESRHTEPVQLGHRILGSIFNPLTLPFVPVVFAVSGILYLAGFAIPGLQDVASDIAAWFSAWTVPEHVNFIHFPAQSPTHAVEEASPYAGSILAYYFTHPGAAGELTMTMLAGVGFHSGEDSFPHAGFSSRTGHGPRPVDKPPTNLPKTAREVKWTYRTLSIIAGHERDVDPETYTKVMGALTIKDKEKRLAALKALSGLRPDQKLEFTDEEKRIFDERVVPILKRIAKYPKPPKK